MFKENDSTIWKILYYSEVHWFEQDKAKKEMVAFMTCSHIEQNTGKINQKVHYFKKFNIIQFPGHLLKYLFAKGQTIGYFVVTQMSADFVAQFLIGPNGKNPESNIGWWNLKDQRSSTGNH